MRNENRFLDTFRGHSKRQCVEAMEEYSDQFNVKIVGIYAFKNWERNSRNDG